MNRDNKDTDKNRDANRDPITKQPGSHPIGTGLGAAAGGGAGMAAGGAAGAAVGGAAGPIGAAAGAAVGAVAGGLGGHAVAEHFDPTGSDLYRYLDYTVVDRNNEKVGTVDAVWEDQLGQPAYVGVKTGWLGLGKAHVVPAHRAEVSDATRKIRLPYSAEAIKNAPSFESQADVDDAAETRIGDYYRSYGFDRDAWQRERKSGEWREGENIQERRGESDIHMPLREEEVRIGKREVESGGIRLRKIIRTETVNQPVELKREDVVVERVPAKDRPASKSDVAFQEEEIYIPLRREEPVVEKTAHTREEVHVTKRSDTERRDVQETVRREDVDIQRKDTGPRDSDKKRR